MPYHRRAPRPRWWRLYLVLPFMAGAFVVEHSLPLAQSDHTLAEIGIVVLVYGWIHLWLRANTAALAYQERDLAARSMVVLWDSRQLAEAQFPVAGNGDEGHQPEYEEMISESSDSSYSR
jgi:hypothetical protein